MSNQIYLVVEGQYSDWRIVGYFTNKDNAERFCVSQYDKYDEPYVMVVDCLDGGIDLSGVKVLYEHEVVFDKRGGTMVMRNEPDRYNIYGGDIRANSVRSMNLGWVEIKVNQKKFNRKQAEKVAQDILYQYLELSHGKLYDQKALKTINDNMSAPQRAREEDRKVAELSEKEMAELARLKQKYEGKEGEK